MKNINVNCSRPAVSVIIPTTCSLKRANMIRRAIDSAVKQEEVALDILVVVNGDQWNPELLAELKGNPHLRVLELEEGNVSLARYAGVLAAKGDFFCFLDDDDELLPEAMKRRAALLHQHEDADLVVTNGYLYNGHDLPLVPEALEPVINYDPAGAFLRLNWFASPAPMFRACAIETNLFDTRQKYFEWTYLFFLLLSKQKNILYDGCFTFRVNTTTPSSASKSRGYFLSQSRFLIGLHSLPLERRIRKAIWQRYLYALNAESNFHLSQRDLKNAWTSHLKCLIQGGWRFLPYTRHLILRRLQR